MATERKSTSSKLNVFVKLPAGISYDVPGIPEPVKFNGYHGQDVLRNDDGAFGVTRNVSAEIFAKIEKDHGDSTLFQGGFIFARDASDDVAEAKAEAKDKGKTKTGLEPLTPETKA